MRINRRQVVTGLAALAGTGAAGLPLRGFAQTRIDLSGVQVHSISDGHLTLPGSMFFDGLPEAELATVLDRHDMSREAVTPPCNLTLVQFGGRNVLFDAGSGAGFMPSAGEMTQSLAALDLTPEDITHVIFTHAHPDHLWGVLDDFDDPVFPQAELLIGAAEWDYWTDPDTVEQIGEARASFAVGAARRLEMLAERFRRFGDGEDILPGITARASFGHTPGHMSFVVSGGDDALLVGGDAIGNHHVALAHPDWPSGADQDPETGIATRVALLDMLAAERMPLMGFHLPGGGLGRIERAGGASDAAYHFVTEDFQ